MKQKEWLSNTKVVDENGRPLVVYHGSEVAWDTYDSSKAPNSHSTYGNTNHIYFSSKKVVAATYLETYPIYKEVPFDTLRLFTVYNDSEQAVHYFAECDINGTPTGKGLPGKVIDSDFGSYIEKPLHGVLEDIPHFNPKIIKDYQYFVIMNQLQNGEFNIDDFKRYETVYQNGNPKLRGTHNLKEDVIYAYQHGEPYYFQPKGVVRSFNVNLENPFIIDAKENSAISPFIDTKGRSWGHVGEYLSERYTPVQAIEDYAKQHGHDGVIIKNIVDIGREPKNKDISMVADTIIAFSPSQIKLVPQKTLTSIENDSNAITPPQPNTKKPTIVFHTATPSTHDFNR